VSARRHPRPTSAVPVALLAAALTLGSAGGGLASSTSSFQVAVAGKKAEKLLDDWQFDEGRAVITEMVRVAPQSGHTLYVEGYARFLEGDYDGSIHKLSAAIEVAPTDTTVRQLHMLATAARDAVKDHKEERSAHFLIRYPAEDAVLVSYALEALESAYLALDHDLGFKSSMPIRVEIYRSPSDLAAVSSLSVAEVARTGTIALCKWARLMVTTPRALSYGYPWLDSINHELVHYAVSSLTRDRAPVWLQEGLAKFLERRWREPAGGRIPPSMEHLLAKALRAGKLISFEAMHPSMAKLPSAEDASLAFAEVANAVAYMHNVGGMPAVRAAVEKVGLGQDARLAVAAATKVTWLEFDHGWRAFMQAQHYRTYAAIDIPTTHIRKANAIASKRKPNEDEALSASQKIAPAYRFLRLGNMMLKRNRLRAAVIEYEKGARAGGDKATAGKAGGAGHGEAAAHWVFPVKLGRTYLALGEPERALKAMAGVQVLYPELPWPNLIAGQALLATGDIPGSVVALRAALATNPFDPAVHCGLATAYARLPAGTSRPPPATIEREQRYCRELAE
jgi:tetratricopeptide (TPR) repeat protein